jgi:hypothetical protein
VYVAVLVGLLLTLQPAPEKGGSEALSLAIALRIINPLACGICFT